MSSWALGGEGGPFGPEEAQWRVQLHVLLTGHTGFKGAWFVMLLKTLGHDVSGIALNPQPESLYSRSAVSELVKHDMHVDIRDADSFARAIDGVNPDFAVHFAAQALVKPSYADPLFTFETNTNGTLNFLASTQGINGLQGRLVITSDKVYRNDHRRGSYSESDPLGGRDPYSASKAMADILAQSWFASFEGIPSAIARAGNVIGGGDSAEYRIVPDIIEAIASSQPLTLRYPNAVRPWQHVLDCLAGYRAIIESLSGFQPRVAWNVGPGEANSVPVRELVNHFSDSWGSPCEVDSTSEVLVHEEALLTLDSSALRDATGWENRLGFEETVEWTVDWEKSVRSGESPRSASMRQIETFLSL